MFQLLGLVTVAVLGVSTASVGVHAMVVRATLTLPLVMFAPGYAALAALLPLPQTERDDGSLETKQLSKEECLVLSVGLSIALTILGGLALNLTSGGIRTFSVALMLAVVTIVGALVAHMRTARIVRPTAPRIRPRISPLHAALFSLAALTTVGALSLTAIDAVHSQAEQFNDLWILPARNSRATVEVGVKSHRAAVQRYVLSLTAGPKTLWISPPQTLRPGQTRTRVVRVPKNLHVPVSAAMYWQQSTHSGRLRVSLWTGG